MLKSSFARLFLNPSFLRKSPKAGRRGVQQRNQDSAAWIESLEQRVMLSATVERQVNAATGTIVVTFGGAGDDLVYVRTAGAQFEWSTNRTNYSQDFDASESGTQSIDVGSFSTFEIHSTGPQLKLESLRLPGKTLSVEANNTIEVENGAVISTRTVGAGDPLSAPSTGPSGNISLTAPRLAVLDGSAILANADNGHVAGNVTLLADDHFDGNAADVLFRYKERETRAEVNVGAATIRGNDINVSSLASNRKITEMPTDLTRSSRAIATGLLNNDSHPDIVVGNYGEPLQVFLGDGQGGYGNGGRSIGTQAFNTTAVALADLNGDTFSDLIVGNYGQPNRLYYSNGNGGFDDGRDIGPAEQTTSLVLHDLNGDQRLDLIVGNYGQPSRVYLNNNGSFAASLPFGIATDRTLSLAVGDFNFDQKADIVVGNEGPNRIYAGNGSGGFAATSFVDPHADKTQSVAIADLDRDGGIDFVVGNDGVNRWYRNTGLFQFTPHNLTITTNDGGTIETTTPEDVTTSVQIVDWDRNGAPDIIVGNLNTATMLYRNDGSGNPFDSVVMLNDGVPTDANPAVEELIGDAFVTAMAIRDMDGDSRPDLVVACDNQLGQTVLNKADGTQLSAIGPTQLTEQITESKLFEIRLLAGVTLVDSGASVVFGPGSRLDAARDITVRSDAVSNASNITASSILAAAYARSLSSGTVRFEGADATSGLSAAQVTAGRDVDVSSTSTNTLFVTVAAVGIAQAAFAQVTLAYGKARSFSETVVEQGVSITGRDVALDAVNRNSFLTSVISAALQPGAPEAGFSPDAGVGFGFSIGDYESSATTQIDGTIRASGSLEVEALSTNLRDATNSSASVTNSPFIGSIGKKITKRTNILAAIANRARAGNRNILWNNKELPVAVGGAITFVDTDNTAHAIIGSTADIIVGANVDVFARAEDNYQVYAAGAAGEAAIGVGGAVCIALVENSSEAIIAPNARVDADNVLRVRSETVVPNQVNFLNLALDLDDNDDTGLDASGRVTRRFEDGINAAEGLKFALDPILALLSSASLVGGTVSTTLAHSTISPSQRTDGRLGVTFGININRLDNDARAAIESGALINQRIGAREDQDVIVEAFSHVETINLAGMPTVLGLVGEPGASQSNAAGGHLDVLTHQTNAIAYIADGARVIAGRDVIVTGSTFNWLISIVQAGGKAGDVSVEGAITFVSMGAETLAYIDDQAEIQAGRDVLVTADNDTFIIDVAGSLTLGGNVAVGVSVALTIVDNNTHAFIGDNPFDAVTPTAPPRHVQVGRDARVRASSDQELWTFALAGTVVAPFDLGPGGTPEPPTDNPRDGRIFGGEEENAKGQSFGIGISGDASLNILDDDVSAFVTNPITTGGDLEVNAENTTLAIATGGALAIAATESPAPAGGGSFSSNIVTKSSLAYLGGVTVNAGDDVVVTSHATNTIVTLAASGSGATRAPAVAGSVTVVTLINNDRAVISSGAIVTAGGDVTVNADNTSRVITVTGAGAGSGNGFGIGAAIGITVVDETAIASIGGTVSDTNAGPPTVVNAQGDLRVTSLSDDFVLAVNASLGLAVSQGIGASGTASSATLTQNVQSLISNGSTVTTPNSLLLDAEANADMANIAGAGAGGAQAAVGATVANTNLFRTNRAAIGNDAVIAAGGAGPGVTDRHNVGGSGVIIDATSDDTFVTVAVGAAVASQGAGIGASVNVATVESDVLATIGDRTRVNATNTNPDGRQSVRLRAEHEIDSVSVAGGAGGSTVAGVGAALDIQVIDRDVRATIGNDAIVNARNVVDVQAHSEEDAVSVVFGIGIATSTAGIAASVSTVNIEGDTQARIGDRTLVNANSTNPPLGNEVRVVATGDTSIFSLGGAVGIGGQVGVGAGASAGGIDTTITARIGESALVKTSTLVLVQAESQEKIVSFATNGGGGGSVGVAGSADVWNVQVDVDSSIGALTRVYSEGTVAVTADGSADLNNLAGAASGGGAVGVGAAAAVLVLDKNVRAHVDNGADITVLGLRGEVSAADSIGESYSSADPSTGDVQPPSNSSTLNVDTDGNGSTDVSRNSASLNQKRQSNILRRGVTGLAVTATSRTDLDTLAISGAGSGSVSVAVGGSVSVAVTTTEATLGDDVFVNQLNTGAGANQDVHIVALSDLHHLGVTAGASGSGVVSVTPGVDVLVVDATTRAAIGNRSTVNVTSDVTVLAKAVENVLSVSAGAAFGGTVGVAGMVAVPSITSHVFAHIGTRTVVDAGGSIAVIALDDTIATSVTGSVGIGFGAAGVGGGVGVIVISKETQATVGEVAKLTSRGTSSATRTHNVDDDLDNPIFGEHGGVIVYARAVEDVFNLVLAGGGGFAAGVAGAVNVTSVESTTLAQVGDYAELTAADDVLVTAVNRADFLSIGGAAGGSAIAGVAGGVAVGVVQNQASAIVGNEAILRANDDVLVLALSDKDASSYAVSLGAAGIAGVAGSFAVWSFGTSINDRFEVTDNVNDNRNGGTSSQNVLALDGRTTSEYGSATQYANSMTGGQHSGGGYGAMLNGYSSEGDQARLGGLTGAAATRINASSSRTQIDFSRHEGGGSQAIIGTRARLTAGDQLAVRANENLKFSSTTGSGAAGVAGVGAAITIVTLNELNQAVIGSGTALTGTHVFVTSSMDEDVSGRAYAGQVGVATLGAQVVVVSDNNSQIAVLDDDVVVLGTNVTIAADAERDVNLDAVGVAVGFFGTAGVSAAVALVGGVTIAEVRDEVTLGTDANRLGGTLTIRANSDADVTTAARAVGAGLGLFAFVTGIGANATGKVTSTVAARVGAGTDVRSNGAVTVEASGLHDISAEALGVSVAFGLAVGAVESRAEINPNIDATVGSGTEIVAQNITVRGRFNHDGSAPLRDGGRSNAYARGQAGGGAVLAGVAGAGVDASSIATVTTTLQNGAVLNAGNVTVRTDASFDADAKGIAVPVAAGVVVGISIVNASANGVAQSTNGGVIRAADADIITNGNAVAKADADAIGGALLAGGVGSQAIANASPNLSTSIASTGSAQTTNSLDVITFSRGRADSLTTAVAINGIASIGGLTSRATVSPLVKAEIGSGATVQAGGASGMKLAALHNVDEIMRTPLANVGALSESGSVFAALGASISAAVTDANAQANVSATLHPSLNLAGSSSIIVSAASANIATANLDSRSGALINVSVSNPEARANGTTVASVQTNVSNVGSMFIQSLSNDRSAVSVLSSNGGGINVGTSNANALSGSTTSALVGNGLTMNLSGDLLLSSNGVSEADSTARGAAGGLVTVNVLNADARSLPVVTSEIGFSTTINAGGTVALNVDAPLNRNSFDRTRAETGDGYTTAASASSSGGLVSVQDANSTTVVNPTALNRLGSSARINAQNISMNASGTSAGEVLTVGAGGGFVSAGGVDAELSRNGRIQNILDNGNTLTASGSITLVTTAIFDDYGKSSANIGGFVAFVSANTKLTLHHTVQNLIGGNSIVTAGGALTAVAQTFLSAFGRSDADSGGLGANSRSSNSDGNVDSQGNKGIRITGTTSTEVYERAHLKANSINLRGQVGQANARMETRARSAGFGTDADTVANVDVFDNASVVIFSDAIVEATNRVDFVAHHQNVNVTSHSSATGASAFGDSDSTSITDLDSSSSVITQPRSKVIAHDLNSEATYYVNNYDRRADQSGGIDFGSQRERGDYLPLQITDWQGDIEINSHIADRRVVINESGQVESISGLTTSTATGVVTGIDNLRWTSDEVGSIRFHSNPIGSFDGKFPLGSTFVTSGFSNTRPTVRFNETLRHIDVVDRFAGTNIGNQTLFFAPIDVVNGSASPVVTIDINNISTLGVVFNVDRHYAPTEINIQTPRQVVLSRINNPIGSTTINAASINFDTITGHDIDLRATNYIGVVISDATGSRLSGIELTQTTAGSPTLYVDAGYIVQASITGLQRVNTQFTARIENLTAQRLDIELNPARSQYSGGEVNPIVVQKTRGGSGFFSTGTFTKNVYSEFRVFTLGIDLDPRVVNRDVFGRTLGEQPAIYQALGRIEATDQAQPDIDIGDGAFLEYLPFTEAGSLPNGVAPGAIQEWADINGDGVLDLATASSYTLTLLINEFATNGGFRVLSTFNTIGPVESLAFGDPDFDGDPDLAIQSGNVTSLMTNVGGTFPGGLVSLPFGRTNGSVGELAWLDFDNDGDLDLLDAGGRLVIHRFFNGFPGDAITVANADYSRVDVGDFDRDGDVDILAGGRGNVGRLLENQGGTFLDTGIEFPRTVHGPLQFGDSDGDGDLDVLSLSAPDGNGRTTLSVYENTGTHFEIRAIGTDFFSSALWTDHDADGDLDLLAHVANLDVNRLYVKNGAQYFILAPRDVPDSATLTGWSTAQIVNGRGNDLIYAGTRAGQPFFKVYENLQPIADSVPPVPNVSASVIADFGVITWAVPAPSPGSSPYTFNVRLQKLGQPAHDISTPSGRGAISGDRFIVTDLENGANYLYSVQTVDSLGRRSAWSAPGIFTSQSTINVNVGGGLDQDVDDGDFLNGQTTLREAINFTNTHDAGFTINVATGAPITVNPLTITRSVSISGGTIVGNGSDRIFNVDDGTGSLIDVTLSGMTLRDGRAVNGGAVYSRENLTLNGVALRGNQATQDGGAVYLDVPFNGRATLTSMVESYDNQAGRDGGVIAINNSGLVEIVAGTLLAQFRNNSAARNGGAISIINAATGQVRSGGRFEAVRSEFSTAGQHGGGIAIVNNGGFLDLSGLATQVNEATEFGGGMYLENHQGVVVLGQRAVLNTARYGGGYYIVNNGGSVLMRNATSEKNEAQGGGGLFINQTGGTFTIEEAYIELNSSLGVADSGAGIYFDNHGGEFRLTTTLLTNNSAANPGGSLRYSSSGNATATIFGSTFQYNSATRGAGLDASLAGGTLNVTSNTFSGNALVGASSTGGAGIDVDLAEGTSAAVVANTIAFNNATASSTGTALDINVAAGGSAVVRNTLVADNTLAQGACAYVVSGDTNRVSNDSNWIGNNAGLKPLALNGGLVPTHGLEANSPAIDRGADADSLPRFDQRGDGFPRAVRRPDVGATERPADGGRTFVVSTPYDDVDGDVGDGKLSLSEAIRLANATVGADTIVFAPSLTGVGLASSGHILFYFQDYSYRITDSLRIVGAGAERMTLQLPTFIIDDGNPNTQINVELSDLTLSNQLRPMNSRENTTLTRVIVSSISGFGQPTIISPDVGASFRVVDSFLSGSQLQVSGPGTTVIDNSTIIAPRAIQRTFGQLPPPEAAIVAPDGSQLTVRNSTLIGQVSESIGAPAVFSPLTGGIDGSATIISSIVPYVGAGSTVTNSLIGNGDTAGLVATSSNGTVVIDMTAPNAPLLPVSSALTNDATPTISGTAEANSRITIVVDPDDDAATFNSFALTTNADDTGDWSIDIPADHALVSGQRASYRVTATDVAHNTSSPATGEFEIDTTAPVAPTIVVPGTVNSRTPTFHGTAEPNSTVTFRVPEYLYAGTAIADGNGLFTIAGPDSQLAEFFHESLSFEVTATDAAGNVSNPTTGSYLTDTGAPLMPSIDNLDDPLTGAMPTITGRGTPGSTIVVTIDPDKNAATTNSFTLTATPNAASDWSVTIPAERALTTGNEVEFQVVEIDAAGNAGQLLEYTTLVALGPTSTIVITSPSLLNDTSPTITGTYERFDFITVTIDPDNDPGTNDSRTFRPSIDINGHWYVQLLAEYGIQDGSVIGISVEADASDDPPTTATITIDASAPDAPVSAIDAWLTTTTPTLRGTAEPLSRVVLTLDPDSNSSTRNSSTLNTTALADGTWSVDVPASAGLRDGSRVSVSIIAIDAAGNAGPAATDSFLIDTTSPTTPLLYVAPQVTVGNPRLSGLADPFTAITLVVDPDNDPGTDNNVTLTTTASATGSFRVDYPSELADGSTASLVAISTDGRGNSSTSMAHAFTVALTDPAIELPVEHDARVHFTGGRTADGTPTIYGTGLPNRPLEVTVDPDGNAATFDSIQLMTTVGGDGSWSVTVPDSSAIPDGRTATFVVVQSDANGNLIGSASGGGALDPRINVISSFGGNLPAASLLADSPAIDAGSNPLGLTHDVRGTGFARVFGAATDIGAYEAQPTIFTVTVANEEDNGNYGVGDLSFREAIKLSNLNPGTDTIRFADSLTSIPISLTGPDQVNPNPQFAHLFPQIAIADSVVIEGRADRSVTLTTSQQEFLELPGAQFRFDSLFQIDDGLASEISVTINGVTLPHSLRTSENVTLENVTLTGTGLFSNVILASGTFTLRDSDINRTMGIYADGTGIDNTTLTLENVTVNAPNVLLNGHDATVVLDQLQINAQDIDYGALGLPFAAYIENNGLVSSLRNVALIVRDADYRSAVGFINLQAGTIYGFPGLPWSYIRFVDENGSLDPDNPLNSVVLDNAQINGWSTPAIPPGTVMTQEDTFIDIDLREYAKLANGDPAGTVSGVLNPVGGTVELLNDGFTARFRPAENFNGAASFQYQVTTDPVATPIRPQSVQDSSGLSTTTLPENSIALGRGTMNVSVAAVDDPFEMRLSPVDATEDQIRDVDLLSLLSDIDSRLTGLTFSLGTASNAQAELLPDGHTVRLSFAQDYFGAASFIFNVTNGTTTYQDQSVSVLVAAANDAPSVTIPDTNPLLKDNQTLSLGDVSISDVDSPNLSLTVSVSSGTLRQGGTTAPQAVLTGSPQQINSQLQTLQFIPQAGVAEIVVFNLQVTDEAPASQSDQFVAGVTLNQAPLLSVTSAEVSATEGETAFHSGNFSDPNNDPVTISASVGTVIQDVDGTWRWSMPTGDGPEDSLSVTITATDSDGAAEQITFDLIVENAAPAFATDNDQANNAVSEGASNGDPVGITAVAADVPGDTVTYSLTDDAGGRFEINPTTGVVTVKDASLLNFRLQASHTITVHATDGTDSSTQDFIIEVTNAPPSAPTDSDVSDNTISEGASNGDAVGVTATAIDIRGDSLSYALTNDAGGRFEIDPTTGVVTVKDASLLDFESATSHTITVQASDGIDTSASDLTIEVTNTPPSAPSDGDAAVNVVSENASNGDAVGITAAAVDVHGGSVTYSLTDDADGRFQIDSTTGAVTVRDSSLLDFESATSHTIVVQATDGLNASATSEFTIEVTNAAPHAAVDGDLSSNSVSEGAANGDLVGITASSSDPGGGSVTYSLADDAGGRFQIDATTGIITVRRGALLNFEGGSSHSITVLASDGRDSSTAVFMIDVTRIPVVAGSSPIERTPEGVLTFDDITAPTSDRLTLSLNGDMLRLGDPAADFGVVPGVGPAAPTGIELLASKFTELEINLGENRDELTLDFTNGNPIPPGGLRYDGGGVDGTIGGDSLIIKNAGLTFTTTIVRPLTDVGGTIEFIVGTDHFFVHYTKLGFVRFDDTQSPNLVIDLNSSANTAALSDLAGANDGMMRLTVVGQLGVDFSAVGLQTLSLLGNDGNDDLSIASLDSVFSGQIILDGGSGDDALNSSRISIPSRLFGGDGEDTLTGGSAGDSLLGGADNDLIHGNSGNDLLHGGDGNDVIHGGTGRDTVEAEAGNDSVYGGDEIDFLDGGAGNDLLSGGLGNDVLTGGLGNDTIQGDDGADVLREVADMNMTVTNSRLSMSRSGFVPAFDLLTSIEMLDLTGGNSRNRIDASGFVTSQGPVHTLGGGGGTDTIIGTNGRDRITTFSSGADSIQGLDGDDTIFSGGGHDTVDGGMGSDCIVGQDGDDSLVGGDGNDMVFGNYGNDVLDGGAGNDKLLGLQGHDRLMGGADNDWMSGDAGNDTLLGGPGNDLMRGSVGIDRFDGGAGGSDRVDEAGETNFVIIGMQISSPLFGTETVINVERFDLTGGPGGNYFDASRSAVMVILNGMGGNDTLQGGSANDLIFGGDGDDLVNGGGGHDRIEGGNGHDSMSGSSGNDSMFGQAGNDVLIGHDGADSVSGGDQDDTLIGGGGTSDSGDLSDMLDGGAGNDTRDMSDGDVTSNVELQMEFATFFDWADQI